MDSLSHTQTNMQLYIVGFHKQLKMSSFVVFFVSIMFISIHMLILKDIISWQLHSQLQVVICKFGFGRDQHDAIIDLLFDQNELDEILLLYSILTADIAARKGMWESFPDNVCKFAILYQDSVNKQNYVHELNISNVLIPILPIPLLQNSWS